MKGGSRPVQDVVNYIAGRLKFLLNEDERGFGEYFAMLERLAENRNLLPNIKEAKDMLTQVDVTKFASYQWGREDGLKEGLEKGIEKGIEKGREQGILMERVRLARQLIGLLDDKTIAEKTGLPEEEVSKLKLH
ncbi:hypothetical protein Thini_1712 [Thiothrix nivea DSM 5205]|uniref:Transposase n=1 Tax=Thiothrix nivea (strain ATCC 35100 / DSM 5205 / JP2) TaxID=870187 RepID=A0A656HGY8_THINJ|nr:hypothetical protein Thini_1712 [Thiothrix nivea DSM 5205]